MVVSVQAFLPRRPAYLQLNRSWCKRSIANSHVRQLDLRARHRERFTCRTARPRSVVACRGAMHYPAADSGRRLEVAYADWLETHKRASYVSPRTRFIARRTNEGTLRAFSLALQRACMQFRFEFAGGAAAPPDDKHLGTRSFPLLNANYAVTLRSAVRHNVHVRRA
jgi:hypothetical protein